MLFAEDAGDKVFRKSVRSPMLAEAPTRKPEPCRASLKSCEEKAEPAVARSPLLVLKAGMSLLPREECWSLAGGYRRGLV